MPKARAIYAQSKRDDRLAAGQHRKRAKTFSGSCDRCGKKIIAKLRAKSVIITYE